MICDTCDGSGYCADMACSNCVNGELIIVDYEVLFNPSKRYIANAISKFAAIDVLYNCPKCDSERVVTWIFPDVSFSFIDDCCKKMVKFVPKEEE